MTKIYTGKTPTEAHADLDSAWSYLTGTAALPTGRAGPTLRQYLENNAVCNVLDLGAVGNGIADDTAALNAIAIQALAEQRTLYFPPGHTFRTSGTVTIHGAVMGRGAFILYYGTGIALKVGDGTEYIQQAYLELPEVTQMNKVGLGWALTDTGILIQRAFQCEIIVPKIRNFKDGLSFYGSGEGCDYNRIFIGHLSNNKRNLVLDASASGWVNENTWYGGRLAHDNGELQAPNTSTTGQPGVRQIAILGTGTGSSILNNHRFYGLSLEGNVPEYHAEVHGQHIYFDRCRWESAIPKVLFTGANAIYNRIHGGYNSNQVVAVQTAGAFNNLIESPFGMRGQASPGTAVTVLSNGDSSATPIHIGMAAGLDVFSTNPTTDYSFALAAQYLKGKNTADPSARMTLDFTTGDFTGRTIRSGLSMNAPNIDASAFAVAIPNGSTYTIPGFSVGLVMLFDSNSGNAALFWVSGTGALISGSANFSGVSGTAAHYNIFSAGGNLKIENLRGADASMMGYVIKVF